MPTPLVREKLKEEEEGLLARKERLAVKYEQLVEFFGSPGWSEFAARLSNMLDEEMRKLESKACGPERGTLFLVGWVSCLRQICSNELRNSWLEGIQDEIRSINTKFAHLVQEEKKAARRESPY